MSFTKLPPIKGSVACLTCGCGSHDTLNLDRTIAVGFGDASVTKNGQTVWSEQQAEHRGDETLWQVSDAESVASKEPDEDWRIHYIAPLYEAHYQRQGDKHWVLVEKGQGFA